MFDYLSDRLQDAFRKLRGMATISEANMADAMREIRVALLEADVNYDVVKFFIEDVRRSCVGSDVLRSVTPGQQVIKIVHDRLRELLGGNAAELTLAGDPAVIMMVGLHGSGKSTTSGKLAKYLAEQRKRRVLLAACDVYRPAAIDQLEFIGEQVHAPVYVERGNVNVPAIARNAVEYARRNNFDTVILDTAGRSEIDDDMVRELVLVRDSVHADEILLVADAALGQEAVSVAEHFHRALDLTGFILTKLDGDARGGAALSIRHVTGQPVKFVGSGEKFEALELFHPERMAGRILGMGDVVTLVERAAQEIDEEEAERLRAKLRKQEFDLNDFLSQLRQLGKLGGMGSVLKMLPGGRQLAGALDNMDDGYFKRLEAIILSMTPGERGNPEIIDFSRRKRIARGSGTPVESVAALLKQFGEMRRMLKKNGLLGRMLSGAMPDVSGPGAGLGALMGGAPAPLNGRERDKRKRLAKLQKKQRQKQRRKK